MCRSVTRYREIRVTTSVWGVHLRCCSGWRRSGQHCTIRKSKSLLSIITDYCQFLLDCVTVFSHLSITVTLGTRGNSLDYYQLIRFLRYISLIDHVITKILALRHTFWYNRLLPKTLQLKVFFRRCCRNCNGIKNNPVARVENE